MLRQRVGAIVETNNAGRHRYGYTREALLHMNIAELRAPETLATLRSDLESIGEGTLFETIHKRSDGSTFPVEVSAVSMQLDGERLCSASCGMCPSARNGARVQRLMTRELLHRVKNSVAVIQSLVR